MGRSVQGSTFGAPARRAKPDAAGAIGERGGQVKLGKPRAWRGLGSLGRTVLNIFGCWEGRCQGGAEGVRYFKFSLSRTFLLWGEGSGFYTGGSACGPGPWEALWVGLFLTLSVIDGDARGGRRG